MGFNIAGVVINKNYADQANLLQTDLGWTLEFKEEITLDMASANWKEDGYCDVFFSPGGTILFVPMDYGTLPWSVAGADTLSFALSETSMAFNLHYCEGRHLVRSFMYVDGGIISEDGKKLPVEEKTAAPDEIIWLQLEALLGGSFSGFDPGEKAYRYQLTGNKGTRDVIYPQRKPIQELTYTEADYAIPDASADPDLAQRADELFDLLTSQEDELVLEAIKKCNTTDRSNYTLAYILNLSFFHRLAKVRKAAKAKLEELAPPGLVKQANEHWKDSYLKNQEYLNKGLFDHPAIDPGEFLLFAQVTSKNYFAVKPKTGMIPYAAMRYNDEIENIFFCYQVKPSKIPAKISRLPHIRVASFRQQPELDIKDTILKLSALPDLHFLQIADSGLQELPNEIAKLTSLKTLILEKNPIASIPAGIVFPVLQKLDIQNTQITELDLSQFPALKELWIEGRNKLATMRFYNIDHDINATSGKYFSFTVTKEMAAVAPAVVKAEKHPPTPTEISSGKNKWWKLW